LIGGIIELMTSFPISVMASNDQIYIALSEEETSRFIDELEKHPVLWDPSHPDYKIKNGSGLLKLRW
jgi:hypothetical protein